MINLKYFLRILSFTILLFSANINFAQNFSIEYGRVNSIFDYRNSDGEKLDNLLSDINNHIGIAVKVPITKPAFYALVEANYNQYGAEGSDSEVGNYYNWKANYIGLDLGIGYEFFKSDSRRYLQSNGVRADVTIFTHAAISCEYLMNGTQTINSQVYDLVGVEQFDKPFVFGKGSLGVAYYATRTLSVYLQYTGAMSYEVFKSESDDNEHLKYITHTLSLGVQICFPYKNYY